MKSLTFKNSTVASPYDANKHANMRASDERVLDAHCRRVCVRELSIARSHRDNHITLMRDWILRWWRMHPLPPPSVARRASNRVGNAKMCPLVVALRRVCIFDDIYLSHSHYLGNIAIS